MRVCSAALVLLCALWCAAVMGETAEDIYNRNKWFSLQKCVVCRAAVDAVVEEHGGVHAVHAQLPHDKLKQVCARYSKPFQEQCDIAMEAVVDRLKDQTEVNRGQVHLLCHRAGACVAAPLSHKQSSATLKKKCKGAKCSVHHHVSNVFVNGESISDLLPQNTNHKTKIPPIFHFIFGMQPDFGGKPFNILHYLAVKSVKATMPHASILMYYKYLPTGVWWERAVKLVKLVKVDPVTVVGANPVFHVAHISDMLRLMLLRDVGGVYLDIDVVTFKSFESLMMYDFVIGQEGKNGMYGLCNAVLMSAPNSTFANMWIDSLGEAWDPNIWSMHSVKLPSMLSHVHPSVITVVNHMTFFDPLWDRLEHMFRGKNDKFESNIAMHTWESLSYDQYIVGLTEDYIMNVSNNFNDAVRKFLP